METIINEKELPVGELKKLGLYQDDQINLSSEDMEALLVGRRTDMRSMVNLQLDGITIRQIDAKLSLAKGADGNVTVNLHPINKEIKTHPLLNDDETQDLVSVKVQSVQKEYADADKILKKLIIEYDEQTREFVAYRPDQVEAPEEVNGETLTDKKKKAFQNGEVVELNDGTRLQHSATDSKGVRSDRKALILSVLLDGGISYLLLRGLRNLRGSDDPQKEGYTKGYNQALADMLLDSKKKQAEVTVGDQLAANRRSEHSRGYGRTASR